MNVKKTCNAKKLLSCYVIFFLQNTINGKKTSIITFFSILKLCISSKVRHHRAATSVIVVWVELIGQIKESGYDFFWEDSPAPKKSPGAVSCFSFSWISLDSILTTWVINGLLLADDCVQKRATFINLITSFSGNFSMSGSTSSNHFPSSWSCHTY